MPRFYFYYFLFLGVGGVQPPPAPGERLASSEQTVVGAAAARRWCLTRLGCAHYSSLEHLCVCVCVCVVQKKQNKQKQPTEADVAGEVRFGAEEQTQTVVDSLCAEGRRLFTHILLHFQKSSLPSLFSDLPPLHPFPLLLWNITPLLPNPHL